MTVETHTITTPGAEITYDVRKGDGPVLLLVGSPMDASGFGTLAKHFTDRTIVTYDPRGVSRSKLTGGATESTPEQHGDDMSAIIDALGGGPVDVFASSGGAVNALALVTAHPGQVGTLVAHEPPIIPVLADRETASAATKGIAELYQREGMGPAMVRFIMMVSHKGDVPAGWIDQPAPSPAEFGLPADDNGDRNDPLLGQNLVSCTHYEPDFEALRAASTRIVIGVGEESKDELANRGGLGVAAGLGVEPTWFPSNHAGFLGGEFGQQGDPDNFAATLRRVLDNRA
ncbi:alpha/beta fold hydrolase [Actinoplanes solisilvae]|uniref:alpha/beta fold hydrolase n=1 Tax=Actinoplanes solisilvae TaxID=2486853 RepID=UPI00196A97F4|nr:alpha/beta hydrolase [Actinoplanes solisilvae]